MTHLTIDNNHFEANQGKIKYEYSYYTRELKLLVYKGQICSPFMASIVFLEYP